ncbi:hypothetical protein WR25_25734 [Diploscapter pachys]|uniref:Uncharacterized protein n=1 Tax=Diploscapter pachys TaxID=2018661 RepID=A0A2A2KW44_9BILA|nr:hypothetical protein WR25_25734 [Diploscapter pachys]
MTTSALFLLCLLAICLFLLTDARPRVGDVPASTAHNNKNERNAARLLAQLIENERSDRDFMVPMDRKTKMTDVQMFNPPEVWRTDVIAYIPDFRSTWELVYPKEDMNYAEHGLNGFVHDHDSSTDNVNKAIKQWANDDTNGLKCPPLKFPLLAV